jgi:hypothetical protein
VIQSEHDVFLAQSSHTLHVCPQHRCALLRWGLYGFLLVQGELTLSGVFNETSYLGDGPFPSTNIASTRPQAIALLKFSAKSSMIAHHLSIL